MTKRFLMEPSLIKTSAVNSLALMDTWLGTTFLMPMLSIFVMSQQHLKIMKTMGMKVSNQREINLLHMTYRVDKNPAHLAGYRMKNA